jgi:phage tail protein X
MAFAQGKLGKMIFIFYPDAKLPGIGTPYTPMYNPTSFFLTHEVQRDKKNKPVVSDFSKKFVAMKPRTLDLELLFDGTGASPSSVGVANKLTANKGLSDVDKQIETFLTLAYTIGSDKHEPNYIMVAWGTFIMTGVLKSAKVTYTMFASDGTPLRAKMNITIAEQVNSGLLTKLLKLLSPDLSKAIVVKEGDTLPLMCFKEYGDSSLYVKVAEVNGLKNYRKLKQGMELLFPPLNNLA